MALPIDNNAKQPKKQGTGFTNIQRLMQANQSNRLGETVAGGVKGQVGRVSQNLGQSQSKFNQDIEAQRQAFEQNKQKVGQVLGNVQNATDEDAKAFEKIRTGTYSGPQGLQNSEQIKTQAALAGQLGQLGATAGGKTELLKRFAGGPQYTSGQSKLDSLLLGTSGAGQLKDARRQAQMLGSQVSSAALSAEEQGKGLKGLTEDLGKKTVEQLRGSTDELYGQIKQAGEDYRAKLAADLAAAQESARTGVFDQRILDQLGLQAGMRTMGVDFSDLIRNVNPDINQYSAANQEQAAKLAALGKLAGSSFDPTEAAALAKYKDSTGIGTLDPSKTLQIDEADRATLQNRIANFNEDLNRQALEQRRAAEAAIATQRRLNAMYDMPDWWKNQNLPEFAAATRQHYQAHQRLKELVQLGNAAYGKTISVKSPETIEKEKAKVT